MGRVIAIANQKGGVAKTTTVVNLGAALYYMRRRVLLIDLDPQASLTVCCGLVPDDLPFSVYHALLKGHPPRDLVRTTSYGPDLLPANSDLSLAEMELVGMLARERRLAGILTELREAYDYLLVDCQPSLGLLTLNALAAADEVLIPVACEYLSIRALKALMRALEKVRLRLNSGLRVLGLLPTLLDARTHHGRSMLQEINRAFGGELAVFDCAVRRSVRFQEAAESGEPIFRFAPEVPGAQAYLRLAREIDGARVALRR